MECNPTSISRRPARRHAFTLIELLVGFGIGSIILAVIIVLASTGAMNLARMLNYAEMDAASQATADQLTRDARRANKVTKYETARLELEDFDGVKLTYEYDDKKRTLTRKKDSTATEGKTEVVLLKECDALTFTLGKRNPTGAFESFPAATAAEGKVIDVSWKCSRTILGHKTTTDNLASAKVVIRRQGP